MRIVLALFLSGHACWSPFVVRATCPPEPFDAARDPDNEALESDLLDAIEALRAQVNGTANLTDTQIDAEREKFSNNMARLTSSLVTINAALDLVDDYESYRGPLFINDDSKDGFSRIFLNEDDKDLERAILAVQQGILDEIYHGSLWHKTHRSDPVDRTSYPIISDCADVLRGRKWLTSTYFPGAADLPVNQDMIYSVEVNITFAPRWGRRVAFAESSDSAFFRRIRPLGGLYLSPGEIATVTVPSSMLEANYTIQVGANMIDNFNKGTHRRMDRITTTFPIQSETAVVVANPLGGALYIRSPYPSELGVVTINVTGGVVQGPIFQMTSLKTTTESDWEAVRGPNLTYAAPWVDLESETFFMQVPSIWITEYSFAHVQELMTNYTLITEAISEIVGIPPDRRNNYALYISVDRYIRYGGYGIGYPQVNDLAPANENGPQLSGFHGRDGAANFWMVTNPLHSATCYHEYGHSQLYGYSMYSGERESIVHVPYTYARNTIYGENMDVSFADSIYGMNPNRVLLPVMSVDRAAIDWMVRENFREGNEMDRSNTETDEIRYQHRGHVKYADMARLFTWQPIKDMYHQEHLDEIYGNPDPCPGLSSDDDRTLRFSIEAGVDLTALIHFWGRHPDDETALKQCMISGGRNLQPSDLVRDQIERYATIVPMNQTAFEEYFNETWPGKYKPSWTNETVNGCPSELYGCGWYNYWYPLWNETLATAAVDAALAIVDKYWPPQTTVQPDTTTTTTPTTTTPTSAGRCSGISTKNACEGTTGCAWNATGPGQHNGFCVLAPAVTTTTTGTGTTQSTPSPGPGDCTSDTECCYYSERNACRSALGGHACNWVGGSSCVPKNRRRAMRGSPLLSSRAGRDLEPPVRSSSRSSYAFDRASARADLQKARGLWMLAMSGGPPRNYEFELEYEFHAPQFLKGPFICTVKSGSVVSVIDKDSGAPVDLAYANDIPSIDGVMSSLDKKMKGKADYANVKYHPRMGFPEVAFVAEPSEADPQWTSVKWTFIRNVVEL